MIFFTICGEFMISDKKTFAKDIHDSLISSSINGGGGYYPYSITFIRIIGQTTGDGGFSHVQKEIR